ncbi:lipoprotein [Salmonella enterica subsp. enterica]|uniref:Lipoprotein n=1 Tax=Salmonella enterica I TaxID=59201 RepID=A0A447PWN6_SALET|nr:lipoprotein [Salmonella enterica subsp. enterica]
MLKPRRGMPPCRGGNSWAIYDDTLPEKGRGNVRWRTLIEQMLNRGGPRLYQKPAVTREGRVHHRELMVSHL